MIVTRKHFLDEIDIGFKVGPIVALLGPRQCGKTTLAKEYIKKNTYKSHFFDAEDPEQRNFLLNNPKSLALLEEELIIIDEVQLLPDIFSYLRVAVDNTDKRFLLLGSASKELVTRSSETLAGRIDYVHIAPFTIEEVKEIHKLWIRGGFPRSFLAENDEISYRWRNNYIMTYLERDMLQIASGLNPNLMRQIWMMLSHYHSNIVNYSEIGRSLGVTDMTIKRYLEVLLGTFMIRKLQPWFENISKRQVKACKIYIRDSGILHNLLGITNINYPSNPKIGASWEGFALEQVIAHYNARSEECYFWNIQSIGEIDLLIVKDGKKIAFEFKYTNSPNITKNIHEMISILKPDKFYIVTPGTESYALSDSVSVWGLG